MIILMITIRIIKGKLQTHRKDADYWLYSVSVAEAITLDAGGYFSADPFAGLASLVSYNETLETSIKNVKLKVLGCGAAKRAAKADVKSTLDDAKDYVNKLARGRQDVADEIITSALMIVILPRVSNKKPLSLKQGKASGEIVMVSTAAIVDKKRVNASYVHEVSYTIEGPKIWAPLCSSPDATTKKKGMPIKVRTFIRRKTITKKTDEGPWTNTEEITLD